MVIYPLTSPGMILQVHVEGVRWSRKIFVCSLLSDPHVQSPAPSAGGDEVQTLVSRPCCRWRCITYVMAPPPLPIPSTGRWYIFLHLVDLYGKCRFFLPVPWIVRVRFIWKYGPVLTLFCEAPNCTTTWRPVIVSGLQEEKNNLPLYMFFSTSPQMYDCHLKKKTWIKRKGLSSNHHFFRAFAVSFGGVVIHKYRYGKLYAALV